MLDQEIKNRLKELEPSYRKFVLSPFASESAKVLGEKNNFKKEQVTILSNGITLYLLIFISFSELIEFITTECGIPKDEAETLAGAILVSLPENFNYLHQTELARLSGSLTTPPQPNTNNEIDKPEESNLTSDIAEVEATISAIPTLHTMKQDISKAEKQEMTHNTAQADILNKIPTAPVSKTPKWGSDTE